MNYKLEAESLLSKFGFYDGDQFLREVEEYYDHCEKLHIKPKNNMISRTLCEVVKQYLLPIIPFEVEYTEVVTMHNPIRLVKLDGEEIKDFNTMCDLLEGVAVVVTSEQVKEIIDNIHVTSSDKI